MKRGYILAVFTIFSIIILTIITAQPIIKQIPNILFLDDLPTQTGYGCNDDSDCPEGQICVDKDKIALTIKPEMPDIFSLLNILDKLSKPSIRELIPISRGFLWSAITQTTQISLMQLASEATDDKKDKEIIFVYYYTEGKDSPEMREIYEKLKEKGLALPTIREVETKKEYNLEIPEPRIAFYEIDNGLVREILKDEEGNEVKTTNPEEFKEFIKEYYYVNLDCEIPPKEPDTSTFPESIDVVIEEPTEDTEPPPESPVESSEEPPQEPRGGPELITAEGEPLENLPAQDTQQQDSKTPEKECEDEDKVTPKVEPPLQLPEPPQEPAKIEEPAPLPEPETPPKPIPGPVEYTEEPVGGRPIDAWGSTWVRTAFHTEEEKWNSFLNMNPKPTEKQIYDMLKNSGMMAKIIIEYDSYLYLDTVKEKVLPKVMDGLVKPKNTGLRDEYEPNLKFTKDYDGAIFKSMVEKYTDTNYEVKGYFSSTKSIPKYSEIIFMTDACGNPSIEIRINHNIDNKGNLLGNPVLGKQLPNGQRDADFRYTITDEKEKQVFNKMFRGMMLFGDENGEAALTRLYNEHFSGNLQNKK